MSLSCTLYQNTGFNTVNIPDSKALLVQDATIKTTVLDCIQNRFLSSISVSTSWDDIKDVDYANVDDFYYFVIGITMTSYDVAQLQLSPDFITSAGGPSSLTILDGITERHHIAKANDTFGKYDEADPLLSPSQPLQIVFGTNAFVQTEGEYYIVAESSIDLYAMGEEGLNYEAYTFTDANTSSNSVTVPKTTPSTGSTTFSLGSDIGLTTYTNGTRLFDVSDEQVRRGIQIARDLGVENAIIAQYALPKSMFTLAITNGVVSVVQATTQTIGTALPYAYTTVRNQRVLSGECNKYGLVTVAGNSYEANPEQINNGGESPSVIFRADGRENGTPFYNFDYYMGVSNATIPQYFRNAITGMEWRNVPLTYTTPAHSVQDSYNYDSTTYRQTLANENAISNFENSQLNSKLGLASSAIGAVVNGASAGASAGGIGAIIGAVAGAAQAGIGVAQGVNNINQAQVNENYRQATYDAERRNELYNFQVSQNVIVPTIKFPFQTPSIRDYAGNGCFVYRYRYSDSDVTRIDKILTAYGYHITEMLTNDMFSNRPHFNFVKANGVSVGNKLPNWWKSGITEQFGAGVRIWHVKPDPAYYTQNE